MRLGIFAKTFAGRTPAAVLGAARAAGYDAVQYNMACSGLDPLPVAIPQDAVAAIRAAVSDTGVGIAAVSATYNMIHPDPTRREAGRAAFEAVASAAPRMGTSLVTVCTGTRDVHDPWRHHPDNDLPESWDEFLMEMRLLLPIAERHGIRIGVEPEKANVVGSASRAREMLETFGPERIGIVLDPANLFDSEAEFRGGAVIEDAVDLLGADIVLAHAKDRDAKGQFQPAGRGIVDFPRFIAALRRSGFEGPVVTHGLSAEQAPDVAGFLRRCLVAPA